MIKELHIAAQYLAAAAISFVEKKDDDSHTNLGWSNELNTFSSRPLNKSEDFLALNFNTYSLEWNTEKETKSTFYLGSKSHFEALNWIREQVKKAGITAAYDYSFHYNLGYGIKMDNYIFPKEDQAEIEKINDLYSIAQNAIQDSLNHQKLSSDIRVWPHHFDIGAYATVNNSLALGFGLAIPDSSIDNFYYYISGYNGEDILETKNFTALTKGEWQTGEWKAGTLKATGMNEQQAQDFLNETINAYRKTYS